MIEVVLQAKTPQIGELIELCAAGKLAFSGPDSLCAKVRAMGFRTTNLYEMVCAVESNKQTDKAP